MPSPRDWRPSGDHAAKRVFRRRGHMWSWDDQPSTMPKAERWIRYALWVGLVSAFVVGLIGLLVQ